MAEKKYIELVEAKRVVKANGWQNPALPDVVNLILDMVPAADVVKVIHGEWIPHDHMSRSPYARNYDCSVCGNSPIENGDFCNKCGARMDGGKHGKA